jgi:endogenous inhibitor of DNA gyrase (YacG/DUF329 family)
MTSKQEVHCPTCAKRGTWKATNRFKPFCSERCKLIDLGEWADEKYRVSGDEANKTDSDTDIETDE